MTPERWQRVKELFAATSALDAAAAAEFLAAACADDADLRAEVESLLGAHRVEEAIVDHPAVAQLPPEFTQVPGERWVGRRIGPYEIIALIGHGGMGDVYHARRADAEYEKDVAIKLVPGGFHPVHVLQRFRAERQILATLDHPNIARLIDGGVTESGTPYLVMGLVEGEPLDQHAGRNNLDVRERLALFLPVCAAVSYAHRHLVVHRDLKPANIFVTADGAVKLLDFGIAKLLQPQGAEANVTPTMTMMRALTPGYSSPEQILGKPVTTASDVYSLGVVLYVLLTGRSPYRRVLETAEDAIREVCNTEPLRPSAAVETANPGCGPLSRDLDAIILKALRKEPERRYMSVDQFAEDIRCFLDGRPVGARGHDFRYRTGKFVRRHRVEVVAAAALVVTLVGATVLSLREARIADQERIRAERHFANVRGLANTLLFDVHDAIEQLPGATHARGVLVANAVKYLDTLAREAAGDAGLRLELASAYDRLGRMQGQPYGANKGDTPAALASYAKAIALLEPLVAADPHDVKVVRALANLHLQQSRLLLLQGDATRAVAGSQRAIGQFQLALAQKPGADVQSELADALQVHLANIYYAGSTQADRRSLGRRAIAILEVLVKAQPASPELARRLSVAYNTAGVTLGGSEPDRATTQEALALYRKALVIDERLLAASAGQNVDHLRDVYADRQNIAINLFELGEVRGALAMIRGAKSVLQKRARDPEDAQVRLDATVADFHEGRYLRELGEEREAEALLTANIATIRQFDLEKDNLQSVFARAASETQLGLIETTRATRAGLGRKAQLRHWRRARDFYAAAVPGFERITRAVTLGYMDMRSVNAARDGLVRSQAAIAQLTSAASAD